MSGIAEIRLYQNTSNSIPVGSFTTVTSDFVGTASSTVVPGVSYDYDNGLKTVNGLQPATTYWFWTEIIDGSGNSTGIQSLGSHTTNPATAIDGSLATVTSTNPTFGTEFSASYIFDGQYGWADDVYASPADSPPVTISFTLSEAKRIVGFRLYSAWHIADGEPHSFPGLVSFSRDGSVLASKNLQISDFQAGSVNAGATSLRNDYVDMFFENTQASTNYSIFCTRNAANGSTVLSIVELVLYEPIQVIPVPALTSSSDQGYTVTASQNANSNYAEWYAFSRIHGFYQGGWTPGGAATPPHYLAIQLPYPAPVNNIRLWSTESWNGIKITSARFEGSNDGTNWTVLATFNGMTYTTIIAADKATNILFQTDFDSEQTTEADDCYVFEGTVTSPGSYKHYRLYVLSHEGNRPSISELVLLP